MLCNNLVKIGRVEITVCKQIIKQNALACSLFRYTYHVETDEDLVSLGKAQKITLVKFLKQTFKYTDYYLKVLRFNCFNLKLELSFCIVY